MRKISKMEAIHKARIALNLLESEVTNVWKVRPIDHPFEIYYLVQLGPQNAVTGVATVDATTGEVGVCARLPGTGPHMTIDSEEAIRLAALEGTPQAELVWKPCNVSKSPLYPFWEVRTLNKIRYVDFNHRVWDEIDGVLVGGK